MVRPVAKKKTLGSSFQQHKKSYFKYKKLLRKEGLSVSQSSAADVGQLTVRKPSRFSDGVKKQKKNIGTNRLLQTYGKVKAENDVKEGIHKRQKQKEIRLQKMKLKKEKHNKLNKWTKKGQPVMKNRMELMLDKIVNDKNTYC